MKGVLFGGIAAVFTVGVMLALEPVYRRMLYTPPSLRTPEKRAMIHRWYRTVVLGCGLMVFLIFLAIFASGG